MAKMKNLQRKIEDIQLALSVLEEPDKYKDKIVRELNSYSVKVDTVDERTLEQLLTYLLAELYDQVISQNSKEKTLEEKVNEAFAFLENGELDEEVNRAFSSVDTFHKTEDEVKYEQLFLNLDGIETSEPFGRYNL